MTTLTESLREEELRRFRNRLDLEAHLDESQENVRVPLHRLLDLLPGRVDRAVVRQRLREERYVLQTVTPMRAPIVEVPLTALLDVVTGALPGEETLATGERLAALLTEAIGYEPVLVSGHTGGKPWGGLTFRTASDRDWLVATLTQTLLDAGVTLPEADA